MHAPTSHHPGTLSHSTLRPPTASVNPAPIRSFPRSLFSREKRKDTRHSVHTLGFLGKLPKLRDVRTNWLGCATSSVHRAQHVCLSYLQLSSFIRTGSLPRPNIFQAATAKLGCSGYAGPPNASSRPQTAHLCDMPSTTTETAEERPARKAKKENKLYTFLTRSRSRSRSKPDLSPPRNAESSHKQSRKTEISGSKPPHRIPSRPLSSTTSSTVTPSIPKARKKPQSSIPVPTSRHPTNDVTNTRKKIYLFGISIQRPSLGSSKSRSKSRSRSGTPQQSADVPPLPTCGLEEESRGSPHAQSSQPSSRPSSPTPPDKRPHAKQPSAKPLFDRSFPQSPANNVSPDTHVGSSKIKEFFAAKDSRRLRHQTFATPASLVSAPVKQGPSLQRQKSKTTTDRPAPAADFHAPFPSLLHSNATKSTTSGIPRTTQPPATPVRSATLPERNLLTPAAAPKSGLGRKNYSLDTGYRYRGTMDIVDEEGRLSMTSKDILVSRVNSKIKGKEKEPEPVSVSPSKSRVNAHVRNTRHGSFDFERPRMGITGLLKTTSIRTATSVASGWSQSGDEVIVRESTFGPGLAGVGTIQRETSMKRGKDREIKEKEILKDAAKKVASARIPEASHKSNASPAHSSNGHRTPPSATNSGKSSSLGRVSGRRFLGKGLSTSRASTQHGLFSFEPPVPSPTWSTPSTSTGKEASSQTERKEKKERAREEKESHVDRKLSQWHDRSPVSLPLSPAGTRSGRKNRSLDLNLGLAWAPSKVREEALLPTSSLFHRSISTKSTPVSPSANNSPNSQDPTSEDMTLEEKSKIGRETAELFRSVLGEARYMRFKTYIYQFDAREIPFDGPTGIISRVDALLATVQTLGLNEKRRLMDKLVRIILQNA